MNTDNLFIRKHIIEVRFPANLLFHEQRFKAFNELNLEFDSINISGKHLEGVIDALYLKIFSTYDKFGSAIENPENFDEYLDKTLINLNNLYRQFKIQFIKRLGSRFIYFLPQKIEFEELKEFLLDKLLNKKNISKLGNIKDIGLSAMDFEDNDFKCHFNIGPMKKEEVKKVCEYPIDNDPEIFIYMDIDIYKDYKYDSRQETNIIRNFIRNSTPKADKIIKKFIENL